MKVIEYKKVLNSQLSKIKKAGKTVGFVPTMGALHKGHFSLIETCLSQNDSTVVSIFVNPIQFTNDNDLKKYPRDVDSDIESLKKHKVNFVFVPSEHEMYPEPVNERYDFGMLDITMEGEYRPGHFNGVAIVVKRLFEIIMPDKAYFGLKDFQQFIIIKELVKQLHMPVEIVSCPIIREEDGLAMSSRNKLLTKEQREQAANISRILFRAKEMAGKVSVEEVKKWVQNQIIQNPFFKLEYFEVVRDIDLQPVKNWNETSPVYGCIAVHVEEVRLIDNIKFNS